MFAKPTIDESTWEDLEAALIGADFGPTVTEETIEDLRASVVR
jgi:fused signal recognition particle receptor